MVIQPALISFLCDNDAKSQLRNSALSRVSLYSETNEQDTDVPGRMWCFLSKPADLKVRLVVCLPLEAADACPPSLAAVGISF